MALQDHFTALEQAYIATLMEVATIDKKECTIEFDEGFEPKDYWYAFQEIWFGEIVWDENERITQAKQRAKSVLKAITVLKFLRSRFMVERDGQELEMTGLEIAETMPLTLELVKSLKAHITFKAFDNLKSSFLGRYAPASRAPLCPTIRTNVMGKGHKRIQIEKKKEYPIWVRKGEKWFVWASFEKDTEAQRELYKIQKQLVKRLPDGSEYDEINLTGPTSTPKLKFYGPAVEKKEKKKLDLEWLM